MRLGRRPLFPSPHDDDTLVSLDDMDNEWIAVQGKEVRVPAGMRLKDLVKALKKEKLALKNLGSITEQSIAGAVSTGTHGTGLTLGSISTHIVAAKLVDGLGNVVTLPKGDHGQSRQPRAGRRGDPQVTLGASTSTSSTTPTSASSTMP